MIMQYNFFQLCHQDFFYGNLRRATSSTIATIIDATSNHYLLLLLLLKKIGNARPGEGDCHPISLKTPPQPQTTNL